jgi:hypothetical protein
MKTQNKNSKSIIFTGLVYLAVCEIALAVGIPEPNRPNINNDDRVNFIDFALFANSWLSTGEGLVGDFDDSNSVDCNDLYIISYYWLEGPPPKTVFEQFKAALSSGDVNTAVSYFTEVSAEKYRIFFEQLSSYLPQMANEMGELIFVRLDTDMAVYDILREESGQICGYPLVFIRDEAGEWKIYDF